MKNRRSISLILVTCLFAAFTLGFLTGRSTAPGDTIVARLPDATQAAAIPDNTQGAAVPRDTPPATTAPEATNPTATPAVVTTPAVTEPPATQAADLININTATLAQLDTLPGIGPVIGQRIIDYREANGPFTELGQLLLIDGIGEKRLAAIIDLITLE